MKMVFVMDPLEGIQRDHDTSYLFLQEAVRRGHQVDHVLPSQVRWDSWRVVFVGRSVSFDGPPEAPERLGPPRLIEGPDLDVVLIRTDPPFDADYLAVTLLLDLLPDSVVILNRPSGLRDANEKLAALHFPDLTPATLVSQDPEAIDEFRQRVGGAIALKPLDGFAGKGVLLIRDGDPNRRALIGMATQGGTVKVVAQQLVDTSQGDKRILVLDGQPLGAVLRRNDTGAFTHNLASGGRALPARVEESDRRIVERIAPWLRQRGLDFVGIDLLGGKLIEINVTSPTCAQELNRFDGIHVERLVLDHLERRANRFAPVPVIDQ